MASSSSIQGADSDQQNMNTGTLLNGSSATGLQNSSTNDQLTQASASSLTVVGEKQNNDSSFPVATGAIITVMILALCLGAYFALKD